MNRNQQLIAAMAGVIALLAIAVAFLIGRQSAAPAPAPANSVATAAPAKAPAPAAPPAPAADPDDALSRWIAGGWAEVETNCETDTGAYYDPSGRYGAGGGEGLWRIENGVLVVTITHEAVGDPMAGEMEALPNPRPERTPLVRESQDRMTLTIGGRPVQMMRCPAAHHSFSS